MLKGGGGFFLLFAISAMSAFGCDSPSPDTGAAGTGGVTGVGGASALGGTRASLSASGTGGMANTDGATVTGGTGASSAASANGPCVSQRPLDNDLTPVHGTIRGPGVEAVICDNGVGTFFLGSGEGPGSYQQALYTALELGATSPGDFSFSMPTNLAYAALDGYAGASTAAIGVYSSSDACGWFRLVLTFPIPPDVACPSLLGPCDPGCAPTNGEMALCEPAHPRRFYKALPSFRCALGDPPLGEWQLTLTSVSPNPSPSGANYYLTHGRLTATLINETDPSDTVQLDLEF